MRIGLNSFLYASPFTTESAKLFAKFKKWGFDTVEIPVEDPSHIDPAKVKAGAEALMAKFPAPEVAVYLNLFQLQQPGGWKEITDAIAADPRLQVS